MKNNIKVLVALAIILCIIPVGSYFYLVGFSGTERNDTSIINACIQKCNEQLKAGTDLSNGPCLSNSIVPSWVCDVVHNPRTEIDNQPENQCSEYGKTANHFVEVDLNCNFISAV